MGGPDKWEFAALIKEPCPALADVVGSDDALDAFTIALCGTGSVRWTLPVWAPAQVQRLLREVFGSDAVCDFGHEQVNGIDAVIDYMVAARGDFVDTRHSPIDFELAIDGIAATARVAKRNRLSPRIGEPAVYTGQYVDALVRAETGWRIVRRISR